MTTKVSYRIYLMVDSHGNKTFAISEESCTTIQVCNMHNKAGEVQYFEAEAYHVDSFCRDNDIELKIINREEDFDSLWALPVGQTKKLFVG